MGKVTENVQPNFTTTNQPTETKKPQDVSIVPIVPTTAGNDSLVGDLRNQGDFWRNLLDKALSPFKTFGSEAQVTRVDGKVIIDAGDGDDQIGVKQAQNGDVTVTVNGKSQTFTGAEKDNIVIKAGDGNDEILVDSNVTVNLTLEGGKGDDKITGGAGDDKIDGGDGYDYLNGFKGKDTINGGADNDVIYGGDDDDVLNGGTGDDYLEGGKGKDTLSGDAGKDLLSGGLDDDTLNGGADNDTLYAGGGKDKLNGGTGDNKVYSQTDDTVEASDAKKNIKNTVVTVELKGNPGGTSINIQGSDAFRERMEADLEFLRSSPNGRAMLTAFDDAKTKSNVSVTIVEISDDNAYADWENRTKPTRPQPFLDQATGKTGTPNNVTISMNPSLMLATENPDGSVTEFPPSVVLFHEMAHGYDMTHGTLRITDYQGTDPSDQGISDSERVAVGLPIDGDKNTRTAEKTDDANHPYNLTENGLRDEMRLERRKHYAARAIRV